MLLSAYMGLAADHRRCAQLHPRTPCMAPAPLDSLQCQPCKPALLQAKASHGVRPGDVVRCSVLPPAPLEAGPEALPLDIVFEDEHLIVINKVGVGVAAGFWVQSLQVWGLTNGRGWLVGCGDWLSRRRKGWPGTICSMGEVHTVRRKSR